MDDDISLILPGQSVPDTLSVEHLPAVVWMRNPKTGVIHKFLRPRDDDSLARCLGERYTASSEAAARAQAIELAKLQGRPLPEWALAEADPEPTQPEPDVEKPAARSKATVAGRG